MRGSAISALSVLPCEAGEGDHAKHGGGGMLNLADGSECETRRAGRISEPPCIDGLLP